MPEKYIFFAMDFLAAAMSLYISGGKHDIAFRSADRSLRAACRVIASCAAVRYFTHLFIHTRIAAPFMIHIASPRAHPRLSSAFRK
jgi:hypothetical protein